MLRKSHLVLTTLLTTMVSLSPVSYAEDDIRTVCEREAEAVEPQNAEEKEGYIRDCIESAKMDQKMQEQFPQPREQDSGV